MIKEDNYDEYSDKLNKNENKINVASLLKYPSFRYKFIILNILWIGSKASFNGVSISSKAFPGNFYVNIIVLFILESISFFITGFLIDIKKLGRKGVLWILYFLVIVSFILLAFINFNTSWNLTLNCIARFGCAGIDAIYYTYTIELYPTQVRSLAFGINATFGSAGSIGAPYLLEFLKNWHFLILLASIFTINAILLIFIPETVGKPMVESIKELDDENNKDKIEKEKKNYEINIEEENNVNKKEDKIGNNNLLFLKNKNEVMEEIKNKNIFIEINNINNNNNNNV